MTTSSPLTLAALGVFILTVAQGCTFPGSEYLQPKVVSYGLLKMDPSITGDYKNKFGAINTLANTDGSEVQGDLTNANIIRIEQYQKDNLFVFTRRGNIFNTNNGGINWRQVSTSEGFTGGAMDFSTDDDSRIVIGGAINATGKIFLSVNEAPLQEIHSDVPGGTNIPFVALNKTNNNIIYAIVRNSVADALIISTDGGSSWRKTDTLPARVTRFGIIQNKLTINLENNQQRVQNNLDGMFPTFDIHDLALGLNANKKVLKTLTVNDANLTLTEEGLYYTAQDGSKHKYILPITDSPVYDFDIEPTNTNHIIAGVGTRLLETFNGGNTWTVRNDVGEEQGAGKIQVTHFDPFVSGQIYLGRGI